MTFLAFCKMSRLKVHGGALSVSASVCIFTGSSDAAYRESTQILCSVQNDQTSEACKKVLFYNAELVLSFCTLLHRIFVLSGMAI